MKRYYDDYAILDAVAATGADIDMDRGYCTVTNLAEAIPVNHVLAFTQDSYAAGVPSDHTYALGVLTFTAGNTYKCRVKQTLSGFDKEYFYYYDGTPTAAGFVDALVEAMNDDVNCPVTATDATASIQLVLDDAAEGAFTATFSVNSSVATVTPTINTAYVTPVGTPTLTGIEVGDASAVSGSSTYERFVITYLQPIEKNDTGAGRHNSAIKTVAVYVNEADGDHAAFDLDAYLLGTKAGKTYNGCKLATVNGVVS